MIFDPRIAVPPLDAEFVGGHVRLFAAVGAGEDETALEIKGSEGYLTVVSRVFAAIDPEPCDHNNEVSLYAPGKISLGAAFVRYIAADYYFCQSVDVPLAVVIGPGCLAKIKVCKIGESNNGVFILIGWHGWRFISKKKTTVWRAAADIA